MADESAQAIGPWDWLKESELRLGGALIFARDVDQDEMFDAFGLDPTSARMTDLAPSQRQVRVGRHDAWTFAIDPWMVSLDLAVGRKNVGERISAGTEAVVVGWTPKPTENFEYWADGVLVTSFEPYMARYRHGSEPDRFLTEMRQLGMVIESDDDDDDGPDDALVAALELATVALGIWLPEQVAMGPLATVTLPAARVWMAH